MYVTAKMEVSKELPGNPIMQDTNSDGSPRYYTYGTTFFNYGMIPQTWEDPNVKVNGYGGDNDPLDVMEIGSASLSITPCKVIGALQFIAEGEMDNNIICIAVKDPDESKIRNMNDLELVKPGYTDKLRDWLKRYKTSDGKPENLLANEEPSSVEDALKLVDETHARWKAICANNSTTSSYSEKFWLQSSHCRPV